MYLIPTILHLVQLQQHISLVKTKNSLGAKKNNIIMSSKGRMMGLCWECERSECICEKGSDDSVSLCSEDELGGERQEESSGANLSFISDPPCAAEESSTLLPPGTTSSPIPAALTSNLHQLGGDQGQENEVKATLPDKSVFVSDFSAYDPVSSTPDLAVYGVSAIRDIIIEPQSSVMADTDVVIYGNHQGGAIKALFNFCPLVQNSPASLHGTRLASIAGGGIYVGDPGPKRLQVTVTNPGGFCKIFIPKRASLGVLEIYSPRY